DEGAAAALCGDLAFEDQVAAVRGVEDGLYGGDILAGADEVGRRPAADEQADAGDEHGLAGAGFAGEDVEARTELHLDLFDDGQVPDLQVAQHRRKSRTSI